MLPGAGHYMDPCRNYEEDTITDIFNKQALPDRVRTELSESMTALVDALCLFFTPHSKYIGIVDPNTSLRYHPSVERLSLYSSKMSPSALKKAKNDPSLSGAGQGDLLKFAADVNNSRIQQKCFTTSRIMTAQVRVLWKAA